MFVVAGPGRADALVATLSISDLTYVPWNVGGGPASYKQTIQFRDVELNGRFLDKVRITVPGGLRDAVESLVPSPVDAGDGLYNNCWTDILTCEIGGSGTITITYKTGIHPLNYPEPGTLTVTATLETAGVSASGKVIFIPKADVVVGPGAVRPTPRRVIFSVENVGPSASGALTVTITGLTRQENITGLTQGCSWAGVNIVCRLAELTPQLNFNQCIVPNMVDPWNRPMCHLIEFWLPPETPEGRLTATASGPYNDPNRSNNTYSRGSEAPPPGGNSGGGNSGGGNSGGGTTGGEAVVATASPEASPEASPSTAQSDLPPRSGDAASAGPPVAQVPSATTGSPAVAWIALVLGVLLAAGGVWYLRRRRAASPASVQGGQSEGDPGM